ncbi:MAG: hypothetical protein ACI83B_002447, partial [Sediminicola sp.]
KRSISEVTVKRNNPETETHQPYRLSVRVIPMQSGLYREHDAI